MGKTRTAGGSAEFAVDVYKSVIVVRVGGTVPFGRFECEGLYYANDVGVGILWFRDSNPTPQVVAHECLHAAVGMFEKLQIGFNTGQFRWEETLCYLLEHMVKGTLDSLALIRGRRRGKR